MRNQWGMSNGEWGRRPAGSLCAHIPHSPLPIPHSFRPGVTLIELLITMAIMAIISAAILGTSSAAMENARRNRSQVLITKIQGLLQERLASYETRRVDVNTLIMNPINKLVSDQASAAPAQFAAANVTRGHMLADVQLLAKRELIKCEMPDHWADVTDDLVFLQGVPSPMQTYIRKYQQLVSSGVSIDKINLNDGAECLYLTIMTVTGDGEARTLFSKQDIGDVDSDGANEFIDGWGNAIAWVRWPAGFVPRSPLMSADSGADHDPLDVYRRDQPGTVPATGFHSSAQPFIARLRDPLPAFRMPPLVYSSGPDGISGINTTNDSIMDAGEKILLDPYC
ncbi:MAG: prepilin-type N-terminal cleavage/methylation domain-containing protein, partial [Pirellulales bacterium]|nr:prepilin-type N-terminal cleavage/methylation domain-containing protein [Pirellulales bacterium]